MELHVGGTLKEIFTGKVTLPELTNDELDEGSMPSGCKCACDQAGWKPVFEAGSKRCWAPLKGVLEALIEQAKQKWAS
jgi:hypothetical protein